MKGRDKGGKENWLLIKADDEYATQSANDDLLEDKPRSVKTGRTVEQVAAGKVKIKRKVAPMTDGSATARPPTKIETGRRSAIPAQSSGGDETPA